MNLVQILIIGALLFSAVVGLIMGIFAWRRRANQGMWAFAVICFGLAWWSFTYAAEIALPGLTTKLWMTRFEYIGITFVPYGWTMFALAYTGREKWLSRTRAIILAVIPVLTIIFAFTNDFHHFFYTAYELNNNGPLSILDASYGLAWYMNFAYAYGMLLVGTVILFIRIFSIPNSFWFQQLLLVISPALPWISNLLYVLRISPVPQLDLSPIAFTLSAFILGMDIFRFRLFDITPLARSVVVDNMNISMLVLDTQGRVVDINPAASRLISRSPADVLGRPVQEVLNRWPEMVERFAGVQEANEEIAATIDDDNYYFRVQISTIYTDAHRLLGRLIMLNDITSAKLTEQALTMAQVRSEFLAKVSHELRTPINGALGTTEMLDYGIYGSVNDAQRKALKQVLERITQLNHLVDDMLQYTTQEGKYFVLESIEFSAVSILQRVESVLGDIAHRKGISLNTGIAPDVPAVLVGDYTHLVQIALNLVDNAVKFTDAGRVDVRIFRPDHEHWAIEVVDTGIGIPEENRQHIFDAFHQAKFTLTHNPGVGLGLSIVKQLIDAMDGTITVQSTEKKGTTFLVVLPLMLPDDKSDAHNVNITL